MLHLCKDSQESLSTAAALALFWVLELAQAVLQVIWRAISIKSWGMDIYRFKSTYINFLRLKPILNDISRFT